MLAQSRQAAKIIGSGGLGKSVRQPGNAVFDERRAEVDPQAEAFVSELDVGERLLLVNRMLGLHRLQFDHDEILDEKSGSEPHIKAQSVVFDRNGNLALYSQPALFEFVGEDGFVNGLE